jgi:nucleoside-diphosphate-sugar epimerase
MKILITGAAGGIGSTLGYELRKAGHELILVDNFRNGYLQNLTINGETYGKFHNVDITATTKLSYLMESEKIEAVIHLAAITALPDCESNKSECVRINVEGTTSVLEACRRNGIDRILFSSTSAVYENNNISDSPYKEELEITPSLFYSLSKKMAEEICNSYSTNYGMNIQILRFFNVMGPRQDLYRKSPPLINYLVKCFMDGESPVLHSDGEQLRDYIHVDDVVSLIQLLLTNEPNSMTINVCSGTLVSLNDIVKYVKEELHSDVEPNYRDASMLWDSYEKLFKDDYSLNKNVVTKEVKKFCLGNNAKAKSFGWIPNEDMEYLIRKTVREIKSNYNSNA